MEGDEYYRRAKQEGYRARSAYKLKQLDDEHDLIQPGDTVVDIGAAPGGWLQVARERADRVVGVDLQHIEPLDDVETIQADITEPETREKIEELVGEADVVTSDASPDLTGNWDVDVARSVHLARAALSTALDVLHPGGNLVVKVFQGRDTQEFREEVKREFEFVRATKPEASRQESSEVYLVAKGLLTAPVREGDEIEVEIEDTGREGDGIARQDGYVLFVSDAEEGETLEVRVTDVKQDYGFAEPL